MRACPGWLAPVKASVSIERSRGPVLRLRPRYPSSVYLVPRVRAQQGEVEEEEAEARETTRSCTHDGEHLTEAPDECRSLARSLALASVLPVARTRARIQVDAHTNALAHAAFFHTCTCAARIRACICVCIYMRRAVFCVFYLLAADVCVYL